MILPFSCEGVGVSERDRAEVVDDGGDSKCAGLSGNAVVLPRDLDDDSDGALDI